MIRVKMKDGSNHDIDNMYRIEFGVENVHFRWTGGCVCYAKTKIASIEFIDPPDPAKEVAEKLMNEAGSPLNYTLSVLRAFEAKIVERERGKR